MSSYFHRSVFQQNHQIGSSEMDTIKCSIADIFGLQTASHLVHLPEMERKIIPPYGQIQKRVSEVAIWLPDCSLELCSGELLYGGAQTCSLQDHIIKEIVVVADGTSKSRHQVLWMATCCCTRGTLECRVSSSNGDKEGPVAKSALRSLIRYLDKCVRQ